MNKWHIIQNQPLLREIFKEPPILSLLKKGLNFGNQTRTEKVWLPILFDHTSSRPIIEVKPCPEGIEVEYSVLLAFFFYFKQYLCRSIQFSITFSVSFFRGQKTLAGQDPWLTLTLLQLMFSIPNVKFSSKRIPFKRYLF